jgi:4-amino-4-deoxy-L-arabinose transferase-like glycosyltransferase
VKARTTVVIAAGWLGFVWVLFLFFQYRGMVKANPWPEYLAAVAAVAAVLLVAAGLGSAIVGRRPRSPGDVFPLAAVGLAVLGIVCLGLAGVGLVRSYVLWALLGGCAVLCRRDVKAVLGRLIKVRGIGEGSGVWIPFAVLAAFGAASYLAASMAPLTANDALVYHLNIPKIYSANQGLIPLPFNVYANMPHYGEVLYTMMFSMAGEAGAKLLYFLILVGAAGATYSLAARFVSRDLAMIAGSLFLVQPVLLDQRVVCNIDVMLTYFYVSAAILLFDAASKRTAEAAGVDKGKARADGGRPRHNGTAETSDGNRPRPARLAISAAILAGFMLGMKYTAVLPCAALLLIPALTASWTWKRVALMAAVALLVFSPWLVKNQVYAGNPVYPMLEGTFGGLNWDRVQSAQLISWQRNMGMGRSFVDYLLLPVRISIMGKPGLNYTRFDGILSPVFLILVPLALLRRRRSTTVLGLMGAAGLVFWALTSQQMRFLIPTIALAAVLAGIGLAGLRERLGPKVFGVVLTLVFLAQASSLIVPDQYGRPVVSALYDRLPAAAGLEAPGEFLGRNIQSYSLFQQMNENIPPGQAVFLIWENRGYYLDRPYFADSFFEASTLMRMVARSEGPADLKRTVAAMGYRYVVVNELLADFFSQPYPPRDRQALADFISQYLTPVHSANRLTLYTIND